MDKKENVLVTSSALFDIVGRFQGFTDDVQKYTTLLDPSHTRYMPREIMEADPSYKQLIPYCIFKHDDTVFVYTRGGGGGEQRLHGKKSVGIGGHICDQDTDYHSAMMREIREEIVLNTMHVETCVGLVNDDSTPVGEVHLGIVHVFQVHLPNIQSNEPDIMCGDFVPIVDIMNNLEDFESWSQLCMKGLFGERV